MERGNTFAQNLRASVIDSVLKPAKKIEIERKRERKRNCKK